MVKRDNNTTLSKFISREVEAIYEKYRNITEEEINLVAKFIRKLEESKVDFYDPYLEYASTKTLAEELVNEDNGWCEALGIEDLGTAYKDEYNSEIYYCLNEGSDIFE